MNSRWLYFLLIVALLLPVTRPRLTGAMIAGSTPISNNSQGNTSQTEEEEVHERTATSRQTHRIARGSQASLGQYSIPQPGRFHSAKTGAAPGIVATHNGFGGHITC
ncbi:hypothetical protein C5Y96_24685 [Blastopirellula marina]|uniref:Uncharacterized protein n=1 Tax=Blastopirellula marina TaxID=124 RepID=A0A2S8F048_9BACT|nr:MULTISPECIES: hypothetical protein [Pirellulaceae]PQO25535.1 hypothetical protein C5Y96_24685 [Blastopirellula marina]RCS42499.1 hypothetical protein DTL36_24735 [Bremerella cremea]